MKYIGAISLSLLLSLAASAAPPADTIRITQLGLQPDSRVNATPFVNEAVKMCKERPGSVLFFPKGRYDFWPQHAIERDYYESNTSDINPKRLAIFFEKMDGITLDGGGSEFIMHDRIQPVTLDNCSNAVLKNFTIDWDVPLIGQGEVTAIGKDYFDLRIDPCKYPYLIENGKLVFVGEGWKSAVTRMMELDVYTGVIQNGDRALGSKWNEYKAAELVPGMIRIQRDGGFRRYPKVGNILSLRHGERDHAGMFINESCNVAMSDITIHHTAGLGILCQYAENLSFDNVDVVPNKAKGRYFSGHDDGIHAMGCKGYIRVTNCEWQYLMDDPINIHGTCVRITEVISPTKVKCRFMESMSVGLRWAVPGDNVGFIDNKTMCTEEENLAKTFTKLNDREFVLETEKPFSAGIKAGMALENRTWTPDVEVRNCRFLSNRARGLLVSTPGKVVIEDNFFASSGSAILIAGDANYWYESGAVRDVLIRNNRFDASCLTSGYQFTEAVISILPEIPEPDPSRPFHRNIRIEDNHFSSADYPILFATSVDGLTFSGNTIERSYEFRPWHRRKAGITVDASKNVKILDNKFVGEVLGRTISIENMDKREVKVSPGSPYRVVHNEAPTRPNLMKR